MNKNCFLIVYLLTDEKNCFVKEKPEKESNALAAIEEAKWKAE